MTFLIDKPGISNAVVLDYICVVLVAIRDNMYHLDRDRIVAYGEVYSIQHYVTKFVSDIRQVGGSLRVLRFSQPIKLAVTI